MKEVLISRLFLCGLIVAMMSAFAGCKRFVDIPPVIEEYRFDSTITVKQSNNRKVLMISIDGLKGDFLSANLPTNISGLLQHSKYIFAPHPNNYFPIDNSSSWGSMLTGNSITRLWDSSFFAVPDTNVYVPIPANLTVARYIKNNEFTDQVAVIAPWESLVNNLLSDADKKVVTTDDQQTKTETINSLANDNAVLTIVQFTSVQKAGLANGFASAQYKQSLNETDTYIGEILQALKSRQNYSKEKWLTLITTAQVRDSVMTNTDYQKSGQYINEFVIAHSDGFSRQDLAELRPPLYVKREDITANILYWLKVPGGIGITNSVPWLNNFELEAN